MLLTKYYEGDQIKEDESGEAYNVHGGDKKYIQRFIRAVWREGTDRETCV